MITGSIKSQIDQIWNAFWTGGISNPLEVIEQITCLLFLRRLDDLQTLAENKSARGGKPVERRIHALAASRRRDSISRVRWLVFRSPEILTESFSLPIFRLNSFSATSRMHFAGSVSPRDH